MKIAIILLVGLSLLILIVKSISKRYTKSLPSEEGFSIHKRKIELEDSEGTVNDAFKKNSQRHQEPGQPS
jgi:hypothetical protein